MKEKWLYALWGSLFVICATMGFLPNPTGLSAVILTLLSIGFFIPGFLLLFRAVKSRDRAAALRLRLIAGLSLLLTVLLLVLSLLSVTGSQAIGDYLHVLLGIFSTPMYCSQSWAVSLFLWACLLVGSFRKPAKK